MSDSELNAYIEQERLKGSDKVAHFELEKHMRTSNAFSIFVLTLIGVSISARKSRGGTGIHLATGVLIGFIYIFFMKMAAVSATNAGVDPLIAVWIPNVLFLILGYFIYRNAPK